MIESLSILTTQKSGATAVCALCNRERGHRDNQTVWDWLVGFINNVYKNSLCECTFDKFIYLYVSITKQMYLRPQEERKCIVQQYKGDWDLGLLKDVLLLGVFCKGQLGHPCMTKGVTVFGCTWVHLGLHLKCACVFIYRTSIKLCKDFCWHFPFAHAVLK